AGRGLTQAEHYAQRELADGDEADGCLANRDKAECYSADRDDSTGHNPLARFGTDAARVVQERQPPYRLVRFELLEELAGGIEKSPPHAPARHLHLILDLFDEKILHAVTPHDIIYPSTLTTFYSLGAAARLSRSRMADQSSVGGGKATMIRSSPMESSR